MGKINPHRLKISQLRALVAIADTGTFSDAGLQLDLSQSSISHAIATLEDELGVVLLHRGRQGATLTPLGETVTAEARVVLASLENITRQAQDARGLSQGVIRVAGFRSVATNILPEVIRQFRVAYPNIQVKIDECQHYRMVEQQVRQGQAEIGFTYLPTSTEFEAWELLRDRYKLLLPAQDTPPPHSYSWGHLMKCPLILAPSDDCCREIIDRYFKKAGYTAKPAYEVREDSTILSMVQQGLGGTIMAELAAEPLPPHITVVDLPMPMERVIGVIQLAEALHPPVVYAFMDILKQIWSPATPPLARTA